MNQRDWQEVAGRMPEDMHLQLLATLDGLEDKKVKHKFRFSTALIAAIITVLLLTGGAFAASRLGLLDYFRGGVNPIMPLEGAEELIVADGFGSAENELAVLTVEEAAFDGKGVLVQARLAPKAENSMMYNAFEQGAPEDLYIFENEQVGENEFNFHVIGRKDGKELVGYFISANSPDVGIEGFNGGAVEQEDGSIIYRGFGQVDASLDIDTIEVRVSAWFPSDEDEGIPRVDELSVTVQIPKGGEKRYAKLEPVNSLDRVEILSGGIVFTPLQGYAVVRYHYDPLPSELMGISLHFCDAEGNRLAAGGGSSGKIDGAYYAEGEIQSFEELPERLWLEAKVVDSSVLGYIECKVTEVEEAPEVMAEYDATQIETFPN